MKIKKKIIENNGKKEIIIYSKYKDMVLYNGVLGDFRIDVINLENKECVLFDNQLVIEFIYDNNQRLSKIIDHKRQKKTIYQYDFEGYKCQVFTNDILLYESINDPNETIWIWYDKRIKRVNIYNDDNDLVDSKVYDFAENLIIHNSINIEKKKDLIIHTEYENDKLISVKKTHSENGEICKIEEFLYDDDLEYSRTITEYEEDNNGYIETLSSYDENKSLEFKIISYFENDLLISTKAISYSDGNEISVELSNCYYEYYD